MFDIIYNHSVMGKAKMTEEGLYYKICCECTLPEDGIYRVMADDGIHVCDLGICVPEDGMFVVNTRIPKKHIAKNNVKFHLVPEKMNGYKVESGKPFLQLDKLNSARLQFTNGQAEIIIDSGQDPQDNDLSQEYPNISEYA